MKECGNVLIWSSEDAIDDTLKPRLVAARADTDRCFFIGDVISERGEKLPFDPARDIPKLDEAIQQIGSIDLLIIDPIVSMVAGDAHRANEVRRSVQPLVDFAERHNCAIIGITHFAKGSTGRTLIDRFIGSQAFVAVARMAWAVVREKDTGRCVLVRAKSNIGPIDGGFEYYPEQTILENGIETSCIEWGETLDGTPEEIIEQIESLDEERRSALDEAKTFLQDLLANGPLEAKQVEAAARVSSQSWGTVRRAQSALNIKPEKGEGIYAGRWYWYLPGDPKAKMLKSENQSGGMDVEHVSET